MVAHWTCSAAGIVSYDFGSFSVSSLGEVASIEVVESSGVFLPAADLLVPGYSWPENYTLTMNVSAEGTELEFTMTSAGTWTAVGTETVTVPAGTFEALRVDGTENITMSGVMGMEPVNIGVNSTYWYAEGVGMVRYAVSSEGTDSGGQLTGYTVP
jgi:hypothetical protein